MEQQSSSEKRLVKNIFKKGKFLLLLFRERNISFRVHLYQNQDEVRGKVLNGEIMQSLCIYEMPASCEDERLCKLYGYEEVDARERTSARFTSAKPIELLKHAFSV